MEEDINNSGIDPKLDWKIRNNIRNNNWKAVAQLINNVIKMENSIEKKEWMDKIYKDVIETWVKGKEAESEVPKQYEEMFIDFARYYAEIEEQVIALNILEKVKDSEKSKIRKKAKRQISLINLKQELLKDGSDTNVEIIEELSDDIEKGNDSKTYMEVLKSLFGTEFSMNQLNLGELEKHLGDTHRIPGNGKFQGKKQYPEDIHVEKRIKFFKEEIDVEPDVRFCDDGIFAGSILLNVRDSDMVIVERLFEIYKDGSYELANQSGGKSSATYVLPKDKVMEMIKYETRKSVNKELENDGLGEWKPKRHTNNWKENVKTAIEKGKRRNLESTAKEESSKDIQTEDIQTEDIQTDNIQTKDIQTEDKPIISEELSIEQLQEQLEMIRQKNIEKEQLLLRQQLLKQIQEEQRRGLELDAQIMEDSKDKTK